MKYTILGSSGFIGSNLELFLRNQAIECFTPPKEYIFSKNENLGHVIYCIGLTADFRQKPMDTVKAHVCKLVEVLENSKFESFLYLSSVRVYNGNNMGTEECSVTVNPLNSSDLYNISKLMGESICLSISNQKIRIVRLSNVIGKDFESDNFLFSLIKEAVDTNQIRLNLPLHVSKDYISIDEVIAVIALIAEKGKERVYNIASGFQISNQQIVNKIKEYTNCSVEVSESSQFLQFPEISIERITNEFNFKPKNILKDMDTLIEHYIQTKHDSN